MRLQFLRRCVAVSWALLLVATVLSAAPGLGAAPAALTTDERAFVDRYEWRNAWDDTRYLSEPNGGWAYSIGVIGKVAGTPALKAAADWIAAKLQSYGWDTAHVEAYPSTSWDFRGNEFRISYAKGGVPVTEELRSINYATSLGTYGTVDGVAYDLSNTADGGVSYPVVNGGLGTSKDLDAAGDLHGKMVLILRNDFITAWPNAPMYEAYYRGARAVVFYGHYGESQNPDSVRGDTIPGAIYDAPIPAFVVTANEAHHVMSLLASGIAVTAYGRAKIDIQTETLARSWNVVAVLPGAKYPDQYVAINAQMDTWFYAPSNSNSGVATALEIARLLGENRPPPDRSVLILINGGEELGGTAGTWFNWLGGSSAFFTVQHPELRGKIVAELDAFNLGYRSETNVSGLDTSWDLHGLVARTARDLGIASNLSIRSGINPFGDEWMFGAVAGASWIAGFDQEGYEKVYHTYNDTMALQNPYQYKILGELYALLVYRLAQGPFLPLDMASTVAWMDASLARDEVTLSDPALASGYAAAAGAIDHLASAWQAAQAKLSTLRSLYKAARDPATQAAIDGQVQQVNARLLQARAQANRYMLGLTLSMPGWWFSFRPDQHAVDGAHLAEAMAALRSGDLQGAADALHKLNGMDWGHRVGQWTWYTLQARFAVRPGWGFEYEQQQEYVDVHSTYLALAAGNSVGAETALASAYDRLIAWEGHDLDLVAVNVQAASETLGAA